MLKDYIKYLAQSLYEYAYKCKTLLYPCPRTPLRLRIEEWSSKYPRPIAILGQTFNASIEGI